jgi:hypothetical protein
MTDNLERRYPTMTAVTDQDGTPGRDPAGDRRPEADGAFGASVRALPPRAALMVAVDVLLAAPEVLEDDGLESCLYIFREKLLARTTPPPRE